MESANLHHHHQQHYHQHQLQENRTHLAGSSSSSSLAAAPSSYYGLGINKHAWSQQPNTTTTTTTTTNLSNPSNSSFNSNSCTNNIMVPDLGFQCWPPPPLNSNNNIRGAGSTSSIKEELSSSSSDSTFPKFTQMLTSTTAASINLVHDDDKDDDGYPFPGAGFIKKERQNSNSNTKEMMMNDLSEKLLLKTLSSGDHQCYSSSSNNVHNFTQLMMMPTGRSGGGEQLHYFSQIYPSINISNLNHQQSSSPSQPSSGISSSSLDMNLQAMDFLASSGFNEPPCNSFGLQQMHQSRINHQQRLLSCGTGSKISSFQNEITEAKRPGSLIEPKATQAAAPAKKSRLESRTHCPPLKVRKEKLGDRIATLQQLVAPFGKTDTASVLMEAIGYIKFLQNQVETLSVPYMKSSRNHNKSSRPMLQGGAMEMNSASHGGDHERKRDLRSRGLCLVPLSCMSYVTAGTTDAAAATGTAGSVNWPNPNYGHGAI